MKCKWMFWMLALLLLTGCGSSSGARQSGTNTVEAAMQAQMAAADASRSQTEAASVAPEQEQDNEYSYDTVDYDLTEMSSDMVYSTVYNMLTQPDDYMGKTVRMDGTSQIYQDPETGKNYYLCVIQDATACCAQGLEYVWGDGSHSDEEYPQAGTIVSVAGVFDTYLEGENNFIYLRDSELTVFR